MTANLPPLPVEPAEVGRALPSDFTAAQYVDAIRAALDEGDVKAAGAIFLPFAVAHPRECDDLRRAILALTPEVER